jgi:hypothetical protein
MLQYIAGKKVQHREDKIKIIKSPWKGICGVYTGRKRLATFPSPGPSSYVTYQTLSERE